MADFLHIDVAGNTELLDELRQAVARLQRPAALMQRLGARIESNIEQRFDAKRDPTGRAWEPLAPSTRERYDRQDTTRRGRNAGQVRRRGSLLERTRQMRSSLVSNAGDDYVEIGMSRLSDGGKWSIPLLHETGTRRMPRRGIFFADPDTATLGSDDDAALSEEIAAFLDEVFGA